MLVDRIHTYHGTDRARIILLSVLLLLVAAPSTVLARERPRITSFTFSRIEQTISFFATDFTKSKGFDYAISSSSARTTFADRTSGSIGANAGGNSWGITPGGARAGERHTFTIAVTNRNGTSRRTKVLCVVRRRGGRAEEGTDTMYAEGVDCVVPAVSEWGMLIIGLLLVTGITIKFGYRRPYHAV